MAQRPDRASIAALRRRFITPEGVDLNIELGSAGARAGAFLLDAVMMLGVLILATIAIGLMAIASQSILMIGLWIVGFFVLRNGWFTLFEMGARGATPGKRIVGLRVVARDGARLTGGAVIARNAMREIEIFLPLSYFFASLGAMFTGGDVLLPLLALVVEVAGNKHHRLTIQSQLVQALAYTGHAFRKIVGAYIKTAVQLAQTQQRERAVARTQG